MIYRPTKLTRAVYVLGVVMLVLSTLVTIPRTPHLADFYSFDQLRELSVTAVAIVIALVGAIRVYGIVSGRVSLEANMPEQLDRAIRMIGLICLYAGVATFAFNLVSLQLGLQYGDITTLILFYSRFGELVPTGILLFEFSRLKSLESAKPAQN